MESGGLSQNDLMNEYKQESNRVWKFVAKRMVFSNEFTQHEVLNQKMMEVREKRKQEAIEKEASLK